MKKIARLSNDPVISRFFVLEADNFSILTECFEKPYQITDTYDFLIMDKKYFVSSFNKYSCPVGVIIHDGVSDGEGSNHKFPDVKYLTWPPSIKEIRNVFLSILNEPILTNKTDHGSDDNIISCYEEEPCVVWYKEKKILLTESEAKLLRLLCDAGGDTVSKEEINSLFDADGGNIGEVYIHRLRRKLEDPFKEKIIQTVRGRGYRIDVKLRIN